MQLLCATFGLSIPVILSSSKRIIYMVHTITSEQFQIVNFGTEGFTPAHYLHFT